MTREFILEGFRRKVAEGWPIIGGGAGTGLSAKCAEAGGIDLIIIYNSGRFRMAGRGSLAGLMPYGDANAIVMEMAREVLPIVDHTPVLAGVCGTDPFRIMDRFLIEIRDCGFAGVQNFPTVGLIDGQFRRGLEETGEKNVDYLAEALAEVARRCPRARPLIVGEGPARPVLEERLGALATFVGFRSGEELADHYAAADLFAFASRTETFGNVVLEAMASGLPAVVLAAGGPLEIVRHSETGLAIDPDEPPSTFAEALLAIAEDAPLRCRMAENARAYARSQSWEEIMGTLRARYAANVEANVAAVAPIG